MNKEHQAYNIAAQVADASVTRETFVLLEALREKLLADIDAERVHLMSISGPTGMRNSQASAMGLARNTVRQEILDFINVVGDGIDGRPTEYR